jgi:hypothetical protein
MLILVEGTDSYIKHVSCLKVIGAKCYSCIILLHLSPSSLGIFGWCSVSKGYFEADASSGVCMGRSISQLTVSRLSR